MGKKQKSKARLDKFYYMAKEHGFRSRAAYKLIQLNKKYEFLSKAKCLVDLCAAPGGWLYYICCRYHYSKMCQFGIVQFSDEFQIRKELKHFKADVVLNDGAPNVGAQWTKDAYNQAELCLHAVKLATDVLRKGGVFVTKVYRSKDYNSLLFVLNQLFSKVEATKPQASRMQSAEIFVVCLGYKAPDHIDPKLLDPKYAFEEVEEIEEEQNKVTSLKKLINQKVNRGGYGDKLNLYQETDLIDFMECSDPYEYLKNYNKFRIDAKVKELFPKYPPPADLDLYCQDLKVLGRGELFTLLKYRQKYQHQNEKEKKNEINKLKKKVVEEKNEDEIEAEIDKELEETIKRVEKERKRQEKKDRIKQQKQDLRKKMSVIASTDINNATDEVLIDKKTFQKLQDIDIEELGYEDDDEDPQDDEERQKDNYYNDLMFQSNPSKQNGKQEVDEEELEDSDKEILRIDKMNEEMENLYQNQKDYKLEKDKKLAKKEKKRKALLEQQRLQQEDLSEEEKLNNEELKPKKVKFGEDLENDSSQEPVEGDSLFVNPLLVQEEKSKKKTQEASEEEFSSESEDEKDKKKKKDKTLGKRKRKGKVDDNFFADNNFEVVPQENIEEGYSSMDSDDIAETRALAKVMLRKKARNEILDGTYNRFANDDDKSKLPQWFLEDEEKHYKAWLPITKEQVAEEKALLKAYNERPSKKVAQAKARKKKRLAKAMNKVKQKAQVIIEQDLNEGSKMRQIEKLYKKEKNKFKEEKQYVVNRNFNNTGSLKTGRGVKLVDKRLKKDLRKQKQMKKKGQKGKSFKMKMKMKKKGPNGIKKNKK